MLSAATAYLARPAPKVVLVHVIGRVVDVIRPHHLRSGERLLQRVVKACSTGKVGLTGIPRRLGVVPALMHDTHLPSRCKTPEREWRSFQACKGSIKRLVRDLWERESWASTDQSPCRTCERDRRACFFSIRICVHAIGYSGNQYACRMCGLDERSPVAR